MRKIENPRLLAFEVLTEVEINLAYSNLILPKYLSLSGMSKSDKGLAAELVYGSLRMKGRHDQFIAHVSDRDIEAIDIKVRIVLRLGVHQLKSMRTPSHAAIYETVELAKRTCGRSAASFVNAILRKVDLVEEEELPLSGDLVSQLAQRFSHPEWIVSAYRDLLKTEKEVEHLLESNNSPAKPNLIAWPGFSTLEELTNLGAEQLPGSEVAAVYDGDPGELAPIKQRRAGVQDFGSQIIVELFFKSYEVNLRWLDLCAGPGGKAAYLSALLAQNSGELLANEISKERSELVKQVLKSGKVINYDGRKLPEEIGKFDRILLDAPCTGLGALRRRPEVRWRRNLQDLKNLTVLQSELLDSAASVTKKNGLIAYVTCSPHQAETTFQIRAFLKRHSEFELIPVEHPRVGEDLMLQLWTHRDGCDAMFMALLRRMD